MAPASPAKIEARKARKAALAERIEARVRAHDEHVREVNAAKRERAVNSKTYRLKARRNHIGKLQITAAATKYSVDNIMPNTTVPALLNELSDEIGKKALMDSSGKRALKVALQAVLSQIFGKYAFIKRVTGAETIKRRHALRALEIGSVISPALTKDTHITQLLKREQAEYIREKQAKRAAAAAAAAKGHAAL